MQTRLRLAPVVQALNRRPVRARLSDAFLMTFTEWRTVSRYLWSAKSVGETLLVKAFAPFAATCFELRFGLFQLGFLLSS